MGKERTFELGSRIPTTVLSFCPTFSCKPVSMPTTERDSWDSLRATHIVTVKFRFPCTGCEDRKMGAPEKFKNGKRESLIHSHPWSGTHDSIRSSATARILAAYRPSSGPGCVCGVARAPEQSGPSNSISRVRLLLALEVV